MSTDALRCVEIRIAGRPPTPNDHRHYRVVAQDNKRWKGIAQTAAWHAMGEQFGPPMRAADIEVEFIVPTRARHDRENLIASIKPCTDGIVSAGVLADDSDEVINDWRFPRARHVPGVTATIYRITELDAGQELGL
jgi:hypothetical protein